MFGKLTKGIDFDDIIQIRLLTMSIRASIKEAKDPDSPGGKKFTVEELKELLFENFAPIAEIFGIEEIVDDVGEAATRVTEVGKTAVRGRRQFRSALESVSSLMRRAT